MSEDYTDLRSVAAGMEQGFQQRGGFDNCLYMLRKAVDASNAIQVTDMTAQLNQLADALVDAIAVVPNHWEMKPKGLAAEHLAREIITAREAEMQRLGGLIKPKQPPQSWYDEDFSGLQGGKSDE